MDHESKELLAQKKRKLKKGRKEQRYSNTRIALQKASNIFLKNTDTRMKLKRSKLKPLSQNSILSNRGSWRSKKFAHIPMEMPTCAF